MKPVSKKEFYDVIGDMDVCVSAVGNYPYRSDFKTRSGVLVGYGQDRHNEEEDIVTDYFLREDLCPKKQ